MNRHKDLASFIREACRRRGVSLGEASQAMGRSRNWLERIVNYDPATHKGIKRPRVDACKDIARYFAVDPNYVLQLAGYISLPRSSTPILDEITTIIGLLPYEDRLVLLEHARLLKFRANAGRETIEFPAVPSIEWQQLDPIFAQELAAFIVDEPASASIWVEALQMLPEKAVELLLINAKNQILLRDQVQRDQAARLLTSLAHQL